MARLRTALGVALAVLAVAWVVRVPVAESDLRPPATPTEGLAGTPAPTPTPTPGTTAPPVEGARRNVAALDPSTLGVTTPSLTTVGQDFRSSAPDTALVLAEPRPDAGGALLRIVATDPTELGPPEDADGWRVERATSVEDMAWFGERDGVVAWITADGVIRVQRLGSPGAYQTLTLPPGRRAADARLLEEDRLAVLTRPSSAEGAVLMVLDVVAHVSLGEALLGEPSGVADASPPVHAWDVDGDRLVGVDPAAEVLWSVSLADATRTEVPLPVPDHRAETGRVWSVLSVDAGEGRVVVSGVDRIYPEGGGGLAPTVSWGVAWFDEALALRARREDGVSVSASVLPGGRVLARSVDGGAVVLDGALQQVAEVLAGRTVVGVFGEAGAQVLTAPTATCPVDVVMRTAGGCTPTALLALDPDDGAVLAERPLDGRDPRWLPQVGLLVTDAAPAS